MSNIKSYESLEEFGRIRLSESFFMLDFLHSEIAAWHRIPNVPDYPDVAISVGRELCGRLLEPLQATFGRIHIRSGYRSPAVNDFGNKNHLNCASNKVNYAAHIWDYPDSEGLHGATACIVIPWLVDHVVRGGQWTDMAWWIHDHLPYSSLYFFPKLHAFNINWHQKPVRRIDSYAAPKGCLTRPGMMNHEGMHTGHYSGLPRIASQSTSNSEPERIWQDGATSPVPVESKHDAHQPESGSAPRATSSEDSNKSPHSCVPESVIRYRAIHEKTKWRKVNSHRSLASAISGRDGAVGLFARKVRIDFERHGDPLFVLVWEEGAQHGYAIKPDRNSVSGIRQVQVPIGFLMECDDLGRVEAVVLESFF